MNVNPLIQGIFGQNVNGQAGIGGGLAGLFSMLLGGQTEGKEGEVDLQSLLKNLSPEEQKLADSLTPLLNKMSKEGFNVDLSSTGLTESLGNIQNQLDALNSNPQTAEAEGVFAKIQVEITIVKTTLEVHGYNMNAFQTSSDLARAFEKMGMDPAEAQAHADRIDAAIKSMQKYLAEQQDKILDGDIGSLMLAFSQPINAVSEDVSITQTQISIQQTSLYIEATYNKSTLDSSSILYAADDVSERILKKEPIVPTTPTEKPTSPTISTPTNTSAQQQQVSQQTATLADSASSETTVEKSAAEQNSVKEVASNAEAASDVIHEEDLAAQQDRRLENSNKRTTSEVQENLSKISGRKIITARVDNGGVQLDYTQEPVLDPLLEPAEADDLQKNSTFENTLTKQQSTSQNSPYAHLLNRSNAQGQTAIHMKSLAKNGGGEIKFKLYPEELGEVQIELEVQNGRVRGAVSVENTEVAEHLARELHRLQEGLEEAGLAFHEEGLEFLVRDENSEGGQGNQHNEDDSEEAGVIASADESTKESSSSWVRPDAIVDVSA